MKKITTDEYWPAKQSMIPIKAAPIDWPEDFNHENGCYQNKCNNCGLFFLGHKRRITCKVCTQSTSL